MKIFLLIYVISSVAGQQPNVQRIEMPSVNLCEEEAQTAQASLSRGDGPYLVRTACVMGGTK